MYPDPPSLPSQLSLFYMRQVKLFHFLYGRPSLPLITLAPFSEPVLREEIKTIDSFIFPSISVE